MNRIIIGDFKSINKIENLVYKEKYNFGVFVDFNSIEIIDFKFDDYDQIVVFIDNIELLKRENIFIQNNKSKIILWIKGKSIKPYINFLKNQGYQVIKELKYLDDNKKVRIKNSFNESKRIIGISGNFEFAILLAEALSDDKNILFIDGDYINCFSGKRLKINLKDEKIYINETYNYEKLEEKNKYRKFHLISFPGGYVNDDYLILENFIKKSTKKIDCIIVYFNEDRNNGRLSELFNHVIFANDITYENIIKVNHSSKVFNNCSYVGIKNKSFIGDYYFLRDNLRLDRFIVLNKKYLLTHSKSLRWIDLKDMDKKMKKKYKELFNKLVDWR